MSELDSRILRLEREITNTGLALNSAPAAAVLDAQRANVLQRNQIPERIAKDIIPLVAIIAVFVLAPFSIALSRFIWRRSSPSARQPAADAQTTQRLEQLQQSVDTIAIEVERISEGQRFVTKVLTDRGMLGAGAAEPVRANASMKSAVPSERG